MWDDPPPRRRSGLIVAIIVVVALLLIGGGATALWLLKRTPAAPTAQQTPAATPAASAPGGSAAGGTSTPPSTRATTPGPNTDTRNAQTGDCLVNRGSETAPDMRKVACGTNTYEVLKRIDGTADKSKCDGTPNLTDWYYYDNSNNTLDFVLCLRKR
jgi:hypothetical protein